VIFLFISYAVTLSVVEGAKQPVLSEVEGTGTKSKGLKFTRARDSSIPLHSFHSFRSTRNDGERRRISLFVKVVSG